MTSRSEAWLQAAKGWAVAASDAVYRACHRADEVDDLVLGRTLSLPEALRRVAARPDEFAAASPPDGRILTGKQESRPCRPTVRRPPT